jgi:hypothetical protein
LSAAEEEGLHGVFKRLGKDYANSSALTVTRMEAEPQTNSPCVCLLQDVRLTQQWLLALAHAGYQFPTLRDTSSPPPAAAAAPQTSALATTPNHARAQPKATQRVPNASALPANWAVFTSVKAPTPAIKLLASLEGWKVVVVADHATPGKWSWPNVTYLSMQQQQALGYSILQHIPSHSHA